MRGRVKERENFLISTRDTCRARAALHRQNTNSPTLRTPQRRLQ